MNTKVYSSKQEKSIARYLNWSVVSGSGARYCSPGDIRSEQFLGECKTHVSRTPKIEFRLDYWKKICDEATSHGRIPVMFADDGSQMMENTYCLVPAAPIDTSEIIVEEYPLKVQSNILMDTQTAKKIKYDQSSVKCYKVKWEAAKQPVLIFSLDTFAQLYGDN